MGSIKVWDEIKLKYEMKRQMLDSSDRAIPGGGCTQAPSLWDQS